MCAGTLGKGKLVDDLDPSQFDSPMRVLSLSSSTKDFKHLLTPVNLKEVFDYPEEFVFPKALHLNL